MTTFARIVDGYTTDVRIHSSATELAACFHPDWLAAHPFVIVPDGTPHGSKDNGNGTYTPTQSPASALSPRVLSWADLTAYLVGLLGGGSTGRTSLGGIIKACQSSAAGGDNYFAAYIQSQGPFSKTEFMSVLNDVSVGIVSAGQKAAVASNWPQA